MTYRVELAEGSGFCFGVRRAIELALATVQQEGVAYSLGPIIHNPQEIDRLARQGLRVVASLTDVPVGAPLIIRSHGAAPEVLEEARRRGVRLIDATCPLVQRAQRRARDLAEAGYRVVVVGEAEHPEVQAIVAQAPGAVVVEDGNSLEELRTSRRLGVVVQTTQSPVAFRHVVGRLLELEPRELRLHNTICSATLHRQQATRALARRADAMVVVGGRNSANTRRLVELCAAEGVAVHHIETAGELEPGWFAGAQLVGVTAGASTPAWVVDRVLGWLGGRG